jgi:hypothetical protein
MTSGRKKGQLAKSALVDRLVRVRGIKGKSELQSRNVEQLLAACIHFGVDGGFTHEEVCTCFPSSFVLYHVHDVMHFMLTLSSHSPTAGALCSLGACYDSP